MRKFDIAPFALPNCASGEYWFEESREIQEAHNAYAFRILPKRLVTISRQATFHGSPR